MDKQMVARKQQIRNIWMVSREYGLLAGAGGVKDVVSQLAEALARWSQRTVNVVLPCYGFLEPERHGFSPLPDPLDPKRILACGIEMNHPDENRCEEVKFFYRRLRRVNVYLVDAIRFRDKKAVYTYTAEDEAEITWQKESMGHHDYFAMNLLLQKAVLELIILLDAKPDVIHCHDGHTAVLPALIREYPGYSSYFRTTACLVTIHNAGFGYHQEVADLPYARSVSGLSENVVSGHLLDGKFDPFLVAGSYSLINTVSENYARELQQSDDDRLTGWLGHQLLYRNKVIEGITNGIDPALFNPAISDIGADFAFDPGKEDDGLVGKERCKASLLELLRGDTLDNGVEQNGNLVGAKEVPLFTFVGRLTAQKGVDVFIEVLKVLMQKEPGFQVLFLGNGDAALEERLLYFTAEEPFCGRVCFLKGYSAELARKVYAAGDFFVIPSRYEPCGLTDFIAQLYGNIPIVHHVGGLVKVRDGYTGLTYVGESQDALLAALTRAIALYPDKKEMRKMQVQAVREIEDRYIWAKVMKKYIELYKKAKNESLQQYKN